MDLCPLSDEEIEDLFSQTDVPLIATCRASAPAVALQPAASQEPAASPQNSPSPDWDTAEHRLSIAIQAGARFADLEIEAPSGFSRRFQKLCKECGTEIIRSYHNFLETPDDHGLQMALARCFRYGADIAKIVTTCHSAEDAARLGSLYSLVLEDIDSLQGRLVAFGMGEEGRESRISCLRRGAPFTYAALNAEEATAPGQPIAAELAAQIYGNAKGFHRSGLRMPASKSFAQRAILAAALAEGRSRLSDYSPCDDSEAAIKVAQALGAGVEKEGSTLIINGIGPINNAHQPQNSGPLPRTALEPASSGVKALPGTALESLDVGESGLLARLSIPVLAAINGKPFRIEGHGTLPRRPMNSAAAIMAAFGVLLTNGDDDAPTEGKREIHVPLTVRGKLIPGNAEVSGSGGSQLISGLLMALPMCAKDSTLHVTEPKSIPYMYITLDVLRHFGIGTKSEMEGDAQLLEAEDWSGCSGITFKVRGGQKYRAASFGIESDWSAAANFLVAGAIFGSTELVGMDMSSIQADIAIIDVLVEAGALVSQMDDGTLCVRRAPLEGFSIDLNHAPDLFPIVAVLAAFCAGESRIAGLGRLAGKESDRARAVLEMLQQMGVEAAAEGDELVVQGETWVSRLLSGRLLNGGAYTSHHDHRMAMALSVAAIGAGGPVQIDDTACVSKSFPDFFRVRDL